MISAIIKGRGVSNFRKPYHTLCIRLKGSIRNDVALFLCLVLMSERPQLNVKETTRFIKKYSLTTY